jgi:hypothetical protein
MPMNVNPYETPGEPTEHAAHLEKDQNSVAEPTVGKKPNVVFRLILTFAFVGNAALFGTSSALFLRIRFESSFGQRDIPTRKVALAGAAVGVLLYILYELLTSWIRKQQPAIATSKIDQKMRETLQHKSSRIKC